MKKADKIREVLKRLIEKESRIKEEIERYRSKLAEELKTEAEREIGIEFGNGFLCSEFDVKDETIQADLKKLHEQQVASENASIEIWERVKDKDNAVEAYVKEYKKRMMELYPQLEKVIKESRNPLLTAIKLSICNHT